MKIHPMFIQFSRIVCTNMNILSAEKRSTFRITNDKKFVLQTTFHSYRQFVGANKNMDGFAFISTAVKIQMSFADGLR